jgi:hypothetical protein
MGWIFFLFIANAITISASNKHLTNNKYAEFFPDFPLELTKEKKGYVILYHCEKPSNSYFVVQFDFAINSWKCIYKGKTPDIYNFSERFREYKCFFIFDSKLVLNEIQISYFDGIVISIGTPDSTVSISKLCKLNRVHSSYYYYPLWEDSEIKNLLYHFKLPNEFSKTNPMVSKMGLKELKKTDVFGNNPRILATPLQEEIHLDNLIKVLKSDKFCEYLKNIFSQYDFDTKCTDEIIHRFFFIKSKNGYKTKKIIPASNYILCLINRYFDNLKIDKAYKLYHNSLSFGNPSFQGTSFETLFNTYISRQRKNCTINIEFEYKFVNNEFCPSAFRRSYIFNVENYVRKSKMIPSQFKDDDFHVPKKFNFPTFSVFKGTIKKKHTDTGKKVYFFFQCTVGSGHDIKKKGYSIIEECLNLDSDIKEVSLIFILPTCSSTFKPTLCPPLKTFNPKIKVYLASFNFQ